MSVLKMKRTVSRAEFVNKASEINVEREFPMKPLPF